MRGAELHRAIEFGLAHVHRDDPAGVRQLCALQHVQPDRAAADHDDTGPRFDFRLAHRRSHAGHYATANDAGAIERNLPRDRDRAGFGNNGVFRMRGRHGIMVHLVATALHARTPVEQKALWLVACERFAQDRLVALAVVAMPAMRVPGTDDVIANLHLRHVAAHRLDDAGPFVPENDRQRIGQRPLDHFQIGMAKPACLDLHQHVGR